MTRYTDHDSECALHIITRITEENNYVTPYFEF